MDKPGIIIDETPLSAQPILLEGLSNKYEVK